MLKFHTGGWMFCNLSSGVILIDVRYNCSTFSHWIVKLLQNNRNDLFCFFLIFRIDCELHLHINQIENQWQKASTDLCHVSASGCWVCCSDSKPHQMTRYMYKYIILELVPYLLFTCCDIAMSCVIIAWQIYYISGVPNFVYVLPYLRMYGVWRAMCRD